MKQGKACKCPPALRLAAAEPAHDELAMSHIGNMKVPLDGVERIENFLVCDLRRG